MTQKELDRITRVEVIVAEIRDNHLVHIYDELKSLTKEIKWVYRTAIGGCITVVCLLIGILLKT